MRATHPAPVIAARSARTAAVTGVVADLLLAAMFAGFAAGATDAGAWVSWTGGGSDLLGSLANLLMIPPALALSRRLPDRRAVHAVHAVGIIALALLAAGGPLLVAGVVAFDVQNPITTVLTLVLAGWVVAVSRWAGSTLSPVTARVGRICGTVLLTSILAIGLVVLAHRTSRLLLVVAGLPGLVAFFGISVWFWLLGRDLAAAELAPAAAVGTGGALGKESRESTRWRVSAAWVGFLCSGKEPS
jgi:hypothetical protein